MRPDSLRALVAQSGLSAQAFARDVLGRDPRTLRRWLSGEVAIPDAAAEWLERVEQVRRGRVAVVIRVRLP